ELAKKGAVTPRRYKNARPNPRNWKFESASLQRRVFKLSVPSERELPKAQPLGSSEEILSRAIVKTMDNQGWVCRTDLFQSIKAFSVTTFDPPRTASWEFGHRTAWHIRSSVAASRRTSWHPHQPCVQSAYPQEAAQGHRGRYANRQPPLK